jgi:tRNA nucleotidyltransferase (CCA-adding enzyme)
VDIVTEPWFEEASYILKRLKTNGYEAYIVGGAVRDYLLGKPVEDVDITTSAKPEEVRALFAKTIPVGIKHGTVVVRYKHRSYEVTTFRQEAKYEDYRHPSAVAFVTSLEEDLKRRDFTMNAMAMTEKGNIIDPFGGENDLKNRFIRTVGRAEERFQEDPLRMMRAVRFASQLSFSIEEKTKKALKKLAVYLQHISVERITAEFEKLLLGQNTKEAFIILVDSRLYAYLPGMEDQEPRLRKLAEIDFTLLDHLCERWAFVCLSLQIAELPAWLRKWKLSNRKINEITQTVKTVNVVKQKGWTPWQIYRAGQNIALSAERVLSLFTGEEAKPDEIKKIYIDLPIKHRGELAIRGNDLLKWFQKKPGPWLSETIQTIEKAVVTGEVKNDREAVRSWVQDQKL